MQQCDARQAPEGYGNSAHVGRLLDALKQAHGWGQQDVADRLGVSVRTVRNWRQHGAPYVAMWVLENVAPESSSR